MHDQTRRDLAPWDSSCQKRALLVALGQGLLSYASYAQQSAWDVDGVALWAEA